MVVLLSPLWFPACQEVLEKSADERNFTRAAATLHVSQPGVSAQIRQLERELGHPLLDRSGRVTQLTEAGEVVLPFARAALGAVADARLAVDELSGLMRGHVAVGMVSQCASLDIPDLLAAFHRQYPAIEITLAEDSSDHLADGVRTGAYDLAFIGLGLRACVDSAYAAAGLNAGVGFEASDPRMLARLAVRGLGLAFLPASAARAHPDGLHVITISDPPMRGRLALAWRAEAPVGPAARALIAHARALLPEPAAR